MPLKAHVQIFFNIIKLNLDHFKQRRNYSKLHMNTIYKHVIYELLFSQLERNRKDHFTNNTEIV